MRILDFLETEIFFVVKLTQRAELSGGRNC